MTILSTKSLLNKFRYIYHIKLAEKRGVKISSDSIDIEKSDRKIQKKISRLLFFKKVKEYFRH